MNVAITPQKKRETEKCPMIKSSLEMALEGTALYS